jgi:hypothetical protein
MHFELNAIGSEVLLPPDIREFDLTLSVRGVTGVDFFRVISSFGSLHYVIF